MTLQQIKEQLSYHYVAAIMSRLGYNLTQSHLQTGVDFSIKLMGDYQFKPNRRRHFEIGNLVDVQLKFTTERQIERRLNGQGKPIVKYDLDAKNYNDMIHRKTLVTYGKYPSLILIVVVFDDDQNEWLSLNLSPANLDFRLTFKGIAYWYCPEKDQPLTSGSQKRIEIPAANVVDFNFAHNLFKIF